MIVMTTSSLVFGLFGSGDLQPWNDTELCVLKEEEKERGLPADERLNITQSKPIEDKQL